MEIVYATGRPGSLEFYTADRREALPPDAIMFAICTSASVIVNTDEDLFNAITEQEYFTIQMMMYEAKRRIAARSQLEERAGNFSLEISVKDFFLWLTNSERRQTKRSKS